MEKKCFVDFISEKNKNFESVQLTYSILCEGPWFCRIWDKDWVEKLHKKNYKEYGESYGKNKFEAYRKALINLKSNP